MVGLPSDPERGKSFAAGVTGCGIGNVTPAGSTIFCIGAAADGAGSGIGCGCPGGTAGPGGSTSPGPTGRGAGSGIACPGGGAVTGAAAGATGAAWAGSGGA